MRCTIEQLNAARTAKRRRCNRGETVGNHGIRQLSKTEQADVDEMRFDGMDALERGLWEIVQGLAWRNQCAEEKLRMYMLENGEANGRLEIPF